MPDLDFQLIALVLFVLRDFRGPGSTKNDPSRTPLRYAAILSRRVVLMAGSLLRRGQSGQACSSVLFPSFNPSPCLGRTGQLVDISAELPVVRLCTKSLCICVPPYAGVRMQVRANCTSDIIWRHEKRTKHGRDKKQKGARTERKRRYERTETTERMRPTKWKTGRGTKETTVREYRGQYLWRTQARRGQQRKRNGTMGGTARRNRTTGLENAPLASMGRRTRRHKIKA